MICAVLFASPLKRVFAYLTAKAFKELEARKARKAKDEEQQDKISNPTADAVLN
jgi:hypothetical protein